jgi:hypothetical protein
MSDIVKAEPDSIPATSLPEVEFALVLSRIIESMKEDPAQLRQNIYELARLKLRRDLLRGDPQEAKRLGEALETAIVGVEAFSQKQDAQALAYGSNSEIAPPAPHRAAVLRLDHSSHPDVPFSDVGADRGARDSAAMHRAPRRHQRPSSAWPAIRLGIGVIVLVLILCGATLRYFGIWTGVGSLTVRKVAAPTSAPKAAPSAAATNASAPPSALTAAPATTVPPQPDFPLPTVYGTYAINNGQLSELEMLPGQVPDIRIAMSSVISTPSHTIVPDGLPTFIVFRRDLANLGQDRVEARVVARIARTLKFGADNKPSTTREDNIWVIRNVAYQFRLAPVAGHPEMIILRPESPDPLPPGRYVLSLKRQPYDFTVAGTITDARHCLERTEAANGIFYSPCKAP